MKQSTLYSIIGLFALVIAIFGLVSGKSDDLKLNCMFGSIAVFVLFVYIENTASMYRILETIKEMKHETPKN